MSWEGFGIFLGLLIVIPVALAGLAALLAMALILGVVTAVFSMPIGVAWALAAIVRPEIVTGRKRPIEEGDD